jgi:hypothetical protein
LGGVDAWRETRTRCRRIPTILWARRILERFVCTTNLPVMIQTLSVVVGISTEAVGEAEIVVGAASGVGIVRDGG